LLQHFASAAAARRCSGSRRDRACLPTMRPLASCSAPASGR
jgi:hypothetical protein